MTAAVLGRLAVPAPWRRPLCVLVVLLALILLVYGDTAAAMVGIWYRSETFAHAFVVPPIALWLIWRQRAALARLKARPVPWMALPMLLLVLGWQLGDLVAVNAVTQLMLVAMLVAAVPAVLGWQVVWTLLFPLAFLFFAVPIGEFLTPVLMQYTADFTVSALRASGVPVFREGLKFVIPSGSWSVVEACSGIRYLMASVMVGALFAYLNYRSVWRRAAFMLVAVMVPIVANWLRAYMIVMIGHLSGNQLATGVDHLVYGWVFFGIVIMAMFFIGARWAQDSEPADAGTAVRPLGGDASTPGRWAASLLLFAVVVAAPLGFSSLLATGDGGGTGVRRPGGSSAGEALVDLTLPATLGARWVSSDAPLPELRPVFPGAASVVSKVYDGGDGPVGVYMAHYRREDPQAKLVSSVNVLVAADDPVWNQLGTQPLKREGASGPTRVRVAELMGTMSSVATDRPRLKVWQFYWIDGHTTASDIEAKLLQAWQRLRGRGEAGTAIVLYTLEGPSNDGQSRLDRLMRDGFADLDGRLRALDRGVSVRP